MRPIFLIPLIFLLSYTCGAQGGAAASQKCFPSGSSLIQAGLSNDRKLVYFKNVNDFIKVFDLSNMNLLDVSKDLKKYHDDFWPVAAKGSYTLKRKTNDFQTGHPQTYQVFDGTGAMVSEYSVDGMDNEYFDPITGCLVTSQAMNKNAYLTRPGQSSKKLIKNTFGYFAVEPAYDKDHNYMVFPSGSVINLKTGAFRGKEFEPVEVKNWNNTKVAFGENGTTYIVNVKSGGLEVHDLATGNLLRSVPVLASLPQIEGFEIIPLAQEGDYIYWLNFNNKWASGGLAYLVRNGVSTSFCDPMWDEESNENYFQTLKTALIDYAAYAQRKEVQDKKDEADRKRMEEVMLQQNTEARKNSTARQASSSQYGNNNAKAYPAYTNQPKSYMEIVRDNREKFKKLNEDAEREKRMEGYRRRP